MLTKRKQEVQGPCHSDLPAETETGIWLIFVLMGMQLWGLMFHHLASFQNITVFSPDYHTFHTVWLKMDQSCGEVAQKSFENLNRNFAKCTKHPKLNSNNQT